MESAEAAEDVMGNIVKGKRTKRQRLMLLQQPASTMTSSSSGGGDDRRSSDPNIPSPTTSSTEEEEDMANCLILLAQGGNPNGPGFQHRLGEGAGERFNSRRFAEAPTTATATASAGKAGFYVYECKTCNRCFPSFQALGGHRASHKKPKVITEEENQVMTSSSPSTPKAIIPYNKARVHECSICGSEFSSGQALGGHMRRHRAAISEAQDNNKKPRSVLALDLNLPAPEEDREFPKSPKSFSFSGKQPLVFSASALVDCHY